MLDGENDPAWDQFKIIRGTVRPDSLPNMEACVTSLITLRNQVRGSVLIEVINNMIYAINHMKHIQQEIELRESRLAAGRRVEPSQEGRTR